MSKSVKFKIFLKEIWRRRVLQVAIPYGIGAWLMVQVAEVILDAFEAPPWIMQGLLIVLVLGYPVAVVLAWIFDITPNHTIVRTGPREELEEEQEEEHEPLPAPAMSLEMGDSERRQITMLSAVFELSYGDDPEADPEFLRDSITVLESVCQDLSDRYEGHKLPSGAEELTLVFGYPNAREDDARRAVAAGLALINETRNMSESRSGEESRGFITRVGISTSLVIVDESKTDNQEISIIGQAPRMAAWLHGLAPPGSLIIGPHTKKIVANHFRLEPAGSHQQTQFGGDIEVFRVETARMLDGSSAELTLLKGREDEMRLMRDRWENVEDGGGQFVLLQGEPGIGKTSLLSSFIQHVRENGDLTLISCMCSPYERNNPLAPVIRVLQDSILGFSDQENSDSRLERLTSFVGLQSVDEDEAVPLLANLLSISPESGYSPPTGSAQIVRMQTLELLLDMLSLAASSRPVLLLIEDLHWADPSTLEMIQMLVNRGPAAGLFVLFSARPHFEADWTKRSFVLVQELLPLARKSAKDLIVSTTGGAELPDAIVNRIIEETDGNPLFIQELTLAVLESDAWRKSLAEGRPEEMRWLEIPATLQDSLAARIDNLGESKALLQLCSVLGREFYYTLLRAVSGTENEQALKDGMNEIVSAELLYQRGVLKNLTYSFKHILILETAYNSLLKSKRKELHGRTAVILEQEITDVAKRQPALLAYHYSEAGELEKAIPFWIQASRQSLSRFANQEAIEQSRKGIELLKSLPESQPRAALEVPLQSILGTALLSTHGYSDPRVRKVFTRAQDLCEQIGDAPQLFQVAVGLWMYYIITAQLEEAYEQSQRLMRIAETTKDPAQFLQAHYSRGFTLYYRADFKAAKAALEKALESEKPGIDYASQSASGDDTRVHVRVVLSLVQWHLGFPQTAARLVKEASSMAKDLKHPYAMAFASFFSAWLQQMRGDSKQTLFHASDAARIALEKGYRFWIPLAGFMTAWAGNRDQKNETMPRDIEPVEKMKSGLDIYRGAGAGMGMTYLSFNLAEDYIALQNHETAVEELESGWSALQETGERFFESEYYRLRGRICLNEFQTSGEQEQLDSAVELFSTALETAQERESLALELRAAVDLAKALELQAQPAEAVGLLSGILNRFGEKDNSQDFVSAEKILKKLNRT
ncbi:MAG: AAA family ATPase [Xanthomonadales bacterium]|nr:AAA family ATPase [Gammaproteobacteria bacterium]NND57007.1 AAA family ATPase [Xanthomonadales bacterium]NNK51876.1 AAA family ATPase [Xanthomonadales bacterium]